MPLVFRLVGRGVGKVSGLVQGGQARMGELSKGSELLQLQNEIRSNLDDLRVIKAELRGAVRLPAGITGSSHPGRLGPSSDSLVGAVVNATSAIRPPLNELPTAMRPPGVSSGRNFEAPTATTLGEMGFGGGTGGTAGGVAGVSRGGGGRVGDGFRERAGVRAAPAGVRAGVEAAVPQPVKSVVSPGGDRLQRLAMAEIGFAEKELYAPKTDGLPGGADILNETITDSLLQERYRQMLEVARGSKSNDGTDNPRS
ncbi:unnamed protein product [Laminaria digitata]